MLALLLLAALTTAGPSGPSGLSGLSWRRVLGLALALAAVLLPLALDASPLERGTYALFTFWGAARVLDLAREPRPLSPVHRMAHVAAIVDTRALRPIDPALRLDTLFAGILWLALCLLALRGAAGHEHVARWALGALFLYAAAEAANNLGQTLLAALGLRSPPLHRTPIAARSLHEFWGDRWNLIVSRWLRAHFFLPQARRRRPRLGLALAFIASAILHAWSVGVAIGPRMAACMGGFFLVQAALIALESWLDTDRWPELAAWAWTMACILLPSPLFTEPLLRVFEAGSLLV